MAVRRLLIGVCAFAVGATLSPGAVLAADPPGCNVSETTARPGLERSFAMHCFRTTEVRLAAAPAHGTLAGLAVDEWGAVTWRYTARADAPGQDRFTLGLSGPAGTAEHDVAIAVIPRAENAEPACDAVETAQRTDGGGPVELRFHVSCTDPEGDEMTVEGSGPGAHLDAPLALGGGVRGSRVSWWRYRTATSSGAERTTYRATDVLGARSADAPIDVTVGPGVDRQPTCQPNPSGWAEDGIAPVFARPGARRRFAITCTDEDGDPIEPRVAEPPARGRFTSFSLTPSTEGPHAPRTRWLDVTYQPDAVYEGRDTFAIAVGDGPLNRMAIVARGAPEDAGDGCGWSPAESSGEAVDVLVSCMDADGDPLTARIVDGADRGSTGLVSVTEVAYGWQEIRVRYTPDAGFQGVDYVKLRIDDGVGEGSDVLTEVRVGPRRAGGPIPPPTAPFPMPSPRVPPPPPSVRLPPMPPPSAPPARAPQLQARDVLGMTDVALVGRLGVAEVFAPRAAVRGGLRRTSVHRALAITCPIHCTIAARPRVTYGARRARSSATRSLSLQRAVAGPGQPGTIRLSLHGTDRRRATRVTYALTIRDALGVTRTGSVSLKLRR